MEFLGPRTREMRWVALEGSIVFDNQGKPVGLRGVTRDITDRKRSEQALAERDTQLALAGKVALVGAFTFDLDTGSNANLARLCSHPWLARGHT